MEMLLSWIVSMQMIIQSLFLSGPEQAGVKGIGQGSNVKITLGRNSVIKFQETA